MRDKQYHVAGFIMIVIVILLFVFSSCTNAKKATAFMLAHPEVSAPFCADEYPVKVNTDSSGFKQSQKIIDSLIAVAEGDKLINQGERTDLINEIERLKNSPVPDCDSISDAVYRLAAKEKQRADKLEASNKELQRAARNVKPIRDTIENTAKAEAYRIELDAAKLQAMKQQAKIDELQAFKDSMKGKVHIPWWILALAGVALAGWAYWRIKAGALNKVLNRFKG